MNNRQKNDRWKYSCVAIYFIFKDKLIKLRLLIVAGEMPEIIGPNIAIQIHIAVNCFVLKMFSKDSLCRLEIW